MFRLFGKSDNRVLRGRKAEQLACDYLKKQGYKIEDTNVRYRFGELDIVAYDKDALCFIEVRSRTSSYFGSPLESVTALKQKHFIAAVRRYLASRKRNWQGVIRFDVVGILYPAGGQPVIELVKGAFEA